MTDFTNDGFESGLTGWTAATTGSGIAPTTTGTTYYEGSNSCKMIVNGEEGESYIIQSIDLTNATGISFACQIPTGFHEHQDGSWGCDMSIWDSEWGMYVEAWSNSDPETGDPLLFADWTEVSTTIEGYTGVCSVMFRSWTNIAV